MKKRDDELIIAGKMFYFMNTVFALTNSLIP